MYSEDAVRVTPPPIQTFVNINGDTSQPPSPEVEMDPGCKINRVRLVQFHKNKDEPMVRYIISDLTMLNGNLSVYKNPVQKILNRLIDLGTS